MAEYPIITDSDAVGVKAEAIFRTLLSPPHWIVNKVERDFGIDFRVEVARPVENAKSQLRGCDFFVQVKGFSEASHKIGTHFDVQVKCSTMRYWKEKLLPVMIVAINVDTTKGHFLWIDKKLPVPPNQEKMTISIPLNKDELLGFKVLYSLAPFWEEWIQEIQDAGKVAVYRKLLADTLGSLHVLLDTYDALLLAPANLLNRPEIIEKVRNEAVQLCYVVITKWLHDVSLYTITGLGLNQMDQQIFALIARAQRAFDSVVVTVSEIGAYGVALRNPEKSIPQLTVFRRIFFEIIDFLSRQNIVSKSIKNESYETNSNG